MVRHLGRAWLDLRAGSGRLKAAAGMKQPQRFLTAEWKKLLFFNYAIDPALLAAHVPVGTELDTWEGGTFVSLIGFEFNSTRVWGMAVPLHRSFEEVNLRFYVRRGERRGVVFLRELVPRLAVVAVARGIFGENYLRTPMMHTVRGRDDGIEAEYAWGRADARCSMRMTALGEAALPGDGSLEQFITEHYWGYATQRNGSALEYEVQHPQWTVRRGESAEFRGDAARFYGPAFAETLARPPDSAYFAEGSAVTVFRGRQIH
jgi:hypothetical protein